MKKLIAFLTIILAFVVSNNVKANPGDSCSNPVAIPSDSTCINDSLPADSLRWYSFVSQGTQVTVNVVLNDSSVGHIHTITLYDSCDGGIMQQVSIDSITQDTLTLVDTNLQYGAQYYLLVSDDSAGCPRCGAGQANYRMCLHFIGTPATITMPVSIFSDSDCGLNYAYSSIPMHGRYNPKDLGGCNAGNSGIGQQPNPPLSPFQFTISGVPTSCVDLVKAYIIFEVVNVAPAYASNATFTINNGTNNFSYSGISMGSSTNCTCWEGNKSAGPPDYQSPCNPGQSIFNLYDNSESYYQDVTTAFTPLTNLNGTYTITGLPCYDPTIPPDCSSNYADADGATLIFIYRDHSANYTGTFTLNGGFFSHSSGGVSFFSLGIPSTCCSLLNQNAFFIAADIESCSNDQYWIGHKLPPPASPYNTFISPPADAWASMWNTVQLATSFGCGVTNCYYSIDLPLGGDCYDMLALGDYYQCPNSCPQLAVTISPNPACPPATLTANVSNGPSPYTYTWSSGQTTSSVSGLSAGTYTVSVTDKYGCIATASAIVNPNPTVSISANPGTTVCCGNLLSLTAVTSPGSFTYLWSDGSTTSSIAVNTLSHCGQVLNYSVTVTNLSTFCQASNNISVTVDGALSVTATASPTTICSGNSSTLTASASGGTLGYTYSWAPGGGTGSSISVTPATTTTYTVTVTDALGCTSTAPVTVTVIPAPSICPGTTQTFCVPCGKPITVNIGPDPLTCPSCPSCTYSWSGSPTVNCPTCAVTSVNLIGPSVSTTYTYTLTVNNGGCIASTTYTIILNPEPVVSISGPDLACVSTGCYCPTVTCGTPPYSYVWSTVGGTVGTGLCCNNGVTVTWSSIPDGGDVILSVTDANGCTGVDTFLVRGCCNPHSGAGGFNEFQDQTLSAVVPNGGSITYSSGTYTITGGTVTPLNIFGVLTVDRNLVLNGVDVWLGTNAKIVVLPGYHIVINSSHLRACDNMWDGIYLSTTTAGTFINAHCSIIEDALHAIVTTGGTPIQISNCVLNRNYIAITAQNFTGTYTPAIANSYITCDALTYNTEPVSCPPPLPGIYPANSPTNLLPPYASNRSLVGIDVSDVNNITLGNASPNTFQDMDYGIYTRRSVVKEQYDNFYSMNQSSLENVAAPAGIYANGEASGTYSIVVGLTHPCTLKDCYVGIWARDTINANIQNNVIAGNPAILNRPIGIFLLNNFKNTLTANGNHINTVFTGVRAINNALSTSTIDNNTIASSPPWLTSFGISVNEYTPVLATTYNASNNTISNVSYGIYFNNLDNSVADANNITTTGNGAANFNEGIHLNNPFQCKVINNIVGISGPGTVADGIRLDHGKTNRVMCNTITANTNTPDYDIAFTGPQIPGTVVDWNTMNIPNANNIGFYLYTAGTVGIQGSAANGTMNSWTPFTGPQWATYVGAAGNPSPYTVFYVNSPPPNTYNPSANGKALPSLTLISFITPAGSDANSCPASLAGPPKALDSASALAIIHDSGAFAAYPQVSSWMDKYSLYKYLILTDSSLDSIPAIKHFRDSAQASNMGIIEHINNLLADSNGVNDSDIAAANYLNTSMVSPDTVESVYQQVNSVLIAMYYAGTDYADTAQQSILKPIANLCPEQYGQGVYEAQAILSLVDTTLYYNMCTGDRRQNARIAQERKDEVMAGSVKVYPNPANTELNIKIDLAKGQIAHICLYNSLGALVQCHDLNGNFTTLPTSELSQGIYYYRVTDANGNLIKADKQMIIH